MFPRPESPFPGAFFLHLVSRKTYYATNDGLFGHGRRLGSFFLWSLTKKWALEGVQEKPTTSIFWTIALTNHPKKQVLEISKFHWKSELFWALCINSICVFHIVVFLKHVCVCVFSEANNSCLWRFQCPWPKLVNILGVASGTPKQQK